MFSRECQQLLGVLFCDWGGELAGVDELQFRGLLGHGRENFRNAVSDEVNRSGTGQVEILFAVRVPDVNPFTAHGHGKISAERSAEDRGAGRDRRGVSHS
jgi:hypothetical protein